MVRGVCESTNEADGDRSARSVASRSLEGLSPDPGAWQGTGRRFPRRVRARVYATARIIKLSIAQAHHDNGIARHHGDSRIFQRCRSQRPEGAAKRRSRRLRAAMVRSCAPPRRFPY